MLPLFFCEQGPTAPVGNFGGITITQQGTKWLATPWYGGRNLGPYVPVTHSSRLVVLQGATTILNAYIANLSDVDPDN